MKKLSVIIPCYNEAENIPIVLEKFSSCIRDEDIEVILVNNGSTDNSSQVLDEVLPNYKFACSMFISENKGYGYGVLQGLKSAESEFLGWTHADMQTDPSDVIKAYHILEEKNWDKNTYVKGVRRGRPFSDSFFAVFMGVFETLYLGKRFYDIHGQPNIFPKSFFDSWKNPPFDFLLDLYAFYQARLQGLEFVRFNCLFPPRIHGKSHWNNGIIIAKLKFIISILKFSKKLKKGEIK